MTVLNRSWKSNIVHCCTKCKYRQHMLKITSTLCVNHLAMQHTSTNVSNMSATSQKTTHQMMTSRTIDSKTPASVRMAQKPVNHENVYHIGLYCHVGWLVRFLHHQQYHHAFAWLELIFWRGATLNLICQATGVAQIRQALGRRSCALKTKTFSDSKKIGFRGLQHQIVKT